MRKYTLLNCLLLAGLMIGFVLMSSCEGPTGPQGPVGPAGTAGPQGPAGADGSDGTPGVDGNAICIACHNLTTKAAVQAQYEESGHFAATTLSRALDQSCGICHGNEGFLEKVQTGRDTLAAELAYATPVQCGTCHDFHQTLDFTNEGPDVAMRINDAVDMLAYRYGFWEAPNDSVVTIDYANNSNLCLQCHQPRRDETYRLTYFEGEDSVMLGTFRYNPHHSAAGGIVWGLIGANIEGAFAYAEVNSSSHSKGVEGIEGSCVGCHMYEKSHTWEPSVDACKACHTTYTGDDFNLNNLQTEVTALLETLKQNLIDNGLLELDDGEYIPVSGKKLYAPHVRALWNYETILEDQSLGVHNPAYVKALLNNSIAIF